jgi:hypothetical protein
VLNGSHSGFAVTSLCLSSCSVPCRALERTLFPPSLRRVSETGLVAGWRQCTLCPVRAVAAQVLPPYITCCASRWGCGAAPGRREYVARTSRDTNCQSWTPATTGRVLRRARTCIAGSTSAVYGSSVGLEVVLPWIDTFKRASHMHAQGCPFSETHCGRVAWNAPVGPHTLRRARSYAPRERAARAGCKRSHTEPPGELSD